MNILQGQVQLQMCVDVEGNAMIWTKRASTHEATHKTDCKHTSLVLIAESVQGLAKRLRLGCVNAAGKHRQELQATAETKITKPGLSFL